MKKLILALMFIGAVIAVIVFLNGRNRVNDLSGLFDEKPPSITGNNSLQNADNPNPENNPVQNENIPVPENINGNKDSSQNNIDNPVSSDISSDENTTDKDSASESDDEPQIDTKENTGNEEKTTFSHSDTEKQMITGRYIEAEEFYYSMLYQQFDLDSYDVIVRKNHDGYNTEYHRVLYFDVNSKAELKACYKEYFTDEFVENLDLGSYIEENGKLYCAETGNASSAKGTKYTYSVESTDENNAVIIRTQTSGSGAQKIPAVKKNGKWYFDSVAIK